MRCLLIGWGVIAASVAVPVLAAGLDENNVRKALLERFDENRNDKLEPLEARQARTRMRNLLEDQSEREINIHTWRDDVKPLLMTLDPDEDRRLTDQERSAATALLERLIPKVDQEQSHSQEKSSQTSSRGERKRDSGNRRLSGYGATGRTSGYGGYVGPWSMGGGGWGMNRNIGFGGGAWSGGNSFNGGSSSILPTPASSGFFSGSGLENANPAKGDLGSPESQTMTKPERMLGSDQAKGRDRDLEPLTDSRSPLGSSLDSPLSSPSGTKPDGRPGKGKPLVPSSPDGLSEGINTSGGDDTPKTGAPVGPMLTPAVPKPAF